MRKWTAAAAAMLALGLAACGGDDENGGNGGGAEGGGESYDMTLIAGVAGDEFYITMNCGAQEKATELGVNLEFQGPQEFSPDQQTPIVDSVAARSPDAILVAPTDSQAMFAPIQQASQNSEIVLVDTTLEQPDMAVSQIASDNIAGGEAAGETLLELIGSEGKVIVINVKPGITTTDQRADGFEQAIDGVEGVEYLGEEFSNNEPAQAAQIVTSTLSAHPDLAGIFATNLFSAQGAATGLRQAGKLGDVKMVGFDAGPQQVEQLEEGLVQALIAQKPAEIGSQGVQQAYNALEGEPVEAEISTGFEVITEDNLDEMQEALYQAEC